MGTKLNNLIKELVKRSSNEEGVVDSSLVENVLAGLRETHPPRHKEILQGYLIEIRKALRQQVIDVELGCEFDGSIITNLQNKIDALSSKSFKLSISRNDQLIAGYRVRLVDDVFEDSIYSRLTKLSQSLTS